MKKLMKYLRGFEKECVLGPLFKLLEASFELLIPLVVAKIVDIGISMGNQTVILQECLIMILLGLIGLLCAVTAQWFAAKAAVGFATRLRHAVMDRILHLSYSQLDTVGESTLITRLTSDVNQVQSGVNLTLRLLLRSPFVVFGAMIMAFTIDTKSAMIFLGVIPVLSLVVFGIMLITMPMYKKVQGALDHVTSAARQNLSGVRVLRAFCMEDQEVRDFKTATKNLTEKQISAGRISALLNPLTFVIINLAVILLVKTGAIQVDRGILTQGAVIALYNYMSQILVELIKLANLIINMTKAAACAGRVTELLSMEPGQENGTETKTLVGKVEFIDVSAAYPGASEPSLEHISFTAQPGQFIGIIGGTGSGKTTFVNLIPRFYDITQGKLLLDGTEVSRLELSCLRQQIAVVPQHARLFRGTIRSNLLWGNPDARDQDLLDALSAAQALDMIKEKGLDGEVEQEGLNFSGGQRQRLTIARALVKKPKILILDDSASALDFATEARLRKALESLQCTIFLVSQRVSSIRRADLILTLEDGRLAGQGSHEELMKTCRVYREICNSQLSEEVKSCEG